jgi:F420-0:gamma-glutamyl ligase
MPKKTRLIHILIEEVDHGRIAAELARRQRARKGKPISFAEWVRQAIRERLVKVAKYSCKRRKSNFSCAACGIEHAKKDMAYSSTLLDGSVEAFCVNCRPPG